MNTLNNLSSIPNPRRRRLFSSLLATAILSAATLTGQTTPPSNPPIPEPFPESVFPDRPIPGVSPGTAPDFTPADNPLSEDEAIEEIASGADSSVSNSSQNRQFVVQNVVLERMEPVSSTATETPSTPVGEPDPDSDGSDQSQETAASESEEEEGMRPYEMPGRFQADAFAGRAIVSSTGRHLETYGLQLGYLFGEKTRYSVNLPVYQVRYDSRTSTSYGLNATVDATIAKGVNAGAHLSGLFTELASENIQTGSAGVFVGYSRHLLRGKLLLSAGALADVVAGKNLKRDVIVASGINLGIALNPHWTLNPNVIYFRNLNTPAAVDRDYVDLGLDLKGYLGDNWKLVIGLRATLDADDLQDAYEISLGSEFRF